LTITAVNPSTNESRSAEIALRGAAVKEAAISCMSDADIHAHVLQTKPLSFAGGGLVVEFRQASVAAVNSLPN
jgi:hypothetical protein